MPKQINSAGQVVPGPYMQKLLANGIGQARYNSSDGISTFNALEATVAQRNFHGLDLQFSYTWSKCLDEADGQGDLAGLARYMAGFVARLEKAGAEIATIPAITAHACMPMLKPLSPLPDGLPENMPVRFNSTAKPPAPFTNSAK